MGLRANGRIVKASLSASAGVALFAATLFSGVGSAQVDEVASPVASPQMGECVPGTGEGAASVTAASTPVSAAVATPAGADVTEAAIAAADNFVNCYNSGDTEAVLTLVSANLLQDKFGLASAEEAAETLPGTELLPYTVLGYGDEADLYLDGRIGLDVVYLAGEYQYVSATWVFADVEGELVLDEEILEQAQPRGDTSVVGFSVAEGGTVGFDQFTEINTNEILTLQGANNTESQHIFSLYRLGGETAATPVADLTELPADAELVGQLSLAAGERGAITLLAPPEGSYLLVDETDGSVATLTVLPPLVVEI